MSHQRKPRLTPHVHQQIVATIRAGGYPHIAAAACGVPASLLDEWLQRGSAAEARAPYRALARAVFQAHAQARLKAEVEVLQEEPKIWLEHGPGRERADSPGWSAVVKPAMEAVVESNVLMQPETVETIRLFTECLTPYPEARQHVANEMDRHGLRLAA